MSSLIDRLANYCLANGVVTEEDVPWFKYGLEKRASTLVVALPFFVLSVILSNIYTALAFYFCFYILRSRINGYHAKTLTACCLLSLLYVALFLGLVYPVLNQMAAYFFAAIGTVLIYFLAPFNHPNMNLSQKEIKVSRTSSRIRSGCMLCITIIAGGVGAIRIAKGISLGIAMAAYLLCLAYILNGGTNYGKQPRKS